jgi:peptidoglycan/xylan/chitin deacetylase (PgdA/CDA1 family)
VNRTRAFQLVLDTLQFSGAGALLAPFLRGRGVVFTLHHVRPAPKAAFAPNRLLEVTPQFLETAVQRVRRAGFEFVTLDEAWRRVESGSGKRFAALTFDDGYRDVRNHALPVLRRLDVPSTLFITTSFADGTGDLWWLRLEEAIRRAHRIRGVVAGEEIDVAAETVAEKDAAWNTLYWRLRALPEDVMRAEISRLSESVGAVAPPFAAQLCMTWDELDDVVRSEPLVSIGAHTKEHFMLAKQPEDVARAELVGSRQRIGDELGVDARHLAYPVGDPTSAGLREFRLAREAGFAAAWTTRPGHLFGAHAQHAMALPRISLNGYFQKARYVDALASGVPSALWNRFRQINVG